MTILAALIVFGVAVGVAIVSTPVVSRVAQALGVVDQPNERKVNRRENIPLAGGVAVASGLFMGLAAAVLLTGDEIVYKGHLEGLLLGGILLLAIGVTDDAWSLSAGPKFIAQISAAAVAILYGFRIDYLTDPFTRNTLWFPEWLVWIATTLWIVLVTNAVNLLDGLDGLAAGVGAIIAATLTIICWQAEAWVGVFMGIALVGSLMGFLPFNFFPGRIFLGDTGALFIGFCLSLLSLEGYRQVSVLTFVVPLLAMAVPIMDVGLSILRRLRSRSHLFRADRQHIHHRLLESEGSVRSAVLSIYFLTLCFCVIAVSFTRLEGFMAILFLLAVVVLTIRLLRNLGFFDTEEPSTDAGPREPTGGS